MTVCNACRYCEQYCPVFPAMELRRTFTDADLRYLANLCHNCGECLYACQFAPPHEYGINVPIAMAGIRIQSYAHYCWPRFLGAAFRRSGVFTALALATLLSAVLFIGTSIANPAAFSAEPRAGEFYAVIPHGVMVTLFGGVFVFVVVAWAIGLSRFWREQGRTTGAAGSVSRAWKDILTLRNLHASGPDCVSAEQAPNPWRRRFHHCTFYGFMLCFASTSVAALYHTVFGWEAPYGYTSLPVILGAAGGLGLLIGPVGQMVVRTRRDRALGDVAADALDDALIVLLFLTSLTGLVLLLLRDRPEMPALLIVHLGVVLALFVTLPYGKFVHGLYRAAALVRAAREGSLE